jgi:hypothetical protein
MNVRRLVFCLLFLGVLLPASGEESFAGRTLALRPVHYGLDFTLDYEQKALRAECRLTLANATERPAASVPLILFRLLGVTSIRDGQGRALSFRQRVVAFEDWDVIQVNFVEADLAAPLAPGERQDLVIDYGGHITGYSAEGMLYVKDHVDEAFTMLRTDGLAYPEIGVPSDKVNRAAGLPDFDYDLRVTVPGPQVAVNPGRLMSATRAGNLTTYAFRSVKPSWRIDVAVADYKRKTGASEDLRVFYLAGDEAGAGAILEAMVKCRGLFTSLFGPLPGNAPFSIIEVPEGYGSQADAACILLTRDSFRDPSRFHELYHEISHLWNVKALDPAPPRFESEGLAVFLEYFAQEKLEGKAGALGAAESRFLERVRSALEKDKVAASTPMIDYGRVDRTDLSYTKGMLFFGLLHRLMGEAEFFKAVAGFERHYAADVATARQFLDWMARSSSVPLERVFEDWITGTGSTKLILSGRTFEDILKEYR